MYIIILDSLIWTQKLRVFSNILLPTFYIHTYKQYYNYEYSGKWHSAFHITVITNIIP